MDSLTPTPDALEGVIVPPEGGPSELVLVKRDPQTFFLDEGFLKALLHHIGTLATSFTPDTTTDKGRKQIASIAYRVSQTKTYLDEIGKTAVAELKDRPKKIDAGRELLREGLDGLRDEVRQPLTEWEDTEKAKAAHLQRLQNWSIQAPGAPAVALEGAITSLAAEPTMDIPGAEEAKRTAMASLREQLAARQQYESDQAELARLRKEQRLRDEEAERERLRLEGEARARKRIEEEAEATRVQAEAAAAKSVQPEAPAPTPEPLLGCDCPSCGRGHLVEEVKDAGFQKCDHCGFRPSPIRTCSEVDETAPDPVGATRDSALRLLKDSMDLLDARKIEETEIRKLLEPAAETMGIENAAEHSVGFLVQETIPHMLAEAAHRRTSLETVHRIFELKDGPLTHVVLKGHPKAFEAHAAEAAAAEREIMKAEAMDHALSLEIIAKGTEREAAAATAERRRIEAIILDWSVDQFRDLEPCDIHDLLEPQP